MNTNCAVKVLIKVKSEIPNADPKDVVLNALKRVIVECKIPGLTYRNLADASYGKIYKDAITILKRDKIISEFIFGKTNVLILTDMIEDGINKYK